MRYVISYDLVAPGKNYEPLWDALRSLGARRILLSQWVTNRTGTDSHRLLIYLREFIDANDRLLICNLDGADWWAYNPMIDPKTI